MDLLKDVTSAFRRVAWRMRAIEAGTYYRDKPKSDRRRPPMSRPAPTLKDPVGMLGHPARPRKRRSR